MLFICPIKIAKTNLKFYLNQTYESQLNCFERPRTLEYPSLLHFFSLSFLSFPLLIGFLPLISL